MDEKQQIPEKMDEPLKLYKRRWAILFLYVIGCSCGNMQWMQYGIIGDVLVVYYGISFEAVNWSSMVFLLFYVIFLFPVSYILDKYGLRVSMILGVIGTAIGAWIKVGSISPDRYWVLLAGQIVVSVAVVSFMAMPAKLAAIWFGSNEVSSACGIGLAGIQLGIAIGFVVPPLVMRSQTDISIIESDLYTIAIGVSIICTVLVVIIIICFPDKPPSPPSQAALGNENQEIKFMQALKKLMTNEAFVLILVAFGIDLAIFCAISALLNQIILAYYPEGFVDAGRIGLLMVVSGIFGSVASGTLLDKFKCYKVATLIMQFLIVAAMITFTYTLNVSIILVYITIGLTGFFMGALWSASFEIVVETTYPVPEGIAVGLLNGSGQAFAIILTYFYSMLFYEINDIWANNSMSALGFIAFILMVFMKVELRREAANFKKDNDNLGFNEVFSSKL